MMRFVLFLTIRGEKLLESKHSMADNINVSLVV